MELTPEIRAQLEEQKKNCVFCKLISGEYPSKKFFEDNKTISMLDIYPVVKGHSIFLTKEHYPIMPYIPTDEFKHLFGLIPQLSKAIKSAMVSTGMNIFIANGGVAGQQAPHFMIHLIPRENGDGFLNFLFGKGTSLAEEEMKILSHNYPIMINNHFKRNPNSWHKGEGERPANLNEVYNNSNVIYEDEKAIVVIPNESLIPGHIKIYSKVEEKFIEKLSIEDSAHLFYLASFAATLVFEGLGAHGTNIIVKSGYSDDNPNGELCFHILPRKQDDDLGKLNWQPQQPKYDLGSIESKIKDNAWNIKYVEVKEEVVEKNELKIMQDLNQNKELKSSEEEIMDAINSLRN